MQTLDEYTPPGQWMEVIASALATRKPLPSSLEALLWGTGIDARIQAGIFAGVALSRCFQCAARRKSVGIGGAIATAWNVGAQDIGDFRGRALGRDNAHLPARIAFQCPFDRTIRAAPRPLDSF